MDIIDNESEKTLQPRKIKSVKREETLRIEKAANDGVCIAHDSEGKTIFVRYVLPGELVRANIYRETSEYAMAEPLEIIEQSDKRITPHCQYFGECGGCDYQMTDYETQIAMKTTLAEEVFRYIGKNEIKVSEVIRSPQQFAYRNTETFKCGLAKTFCGRNKHIGFFRKDTRFIVNVDKCAIGMQGINDALASVRAGEYPQQNFKVRTTLDGDTVVHWIKNDTYQDREVYETVNAAGLSIKFKISKDSFFQVNDYVVPLWLEKIISFLEKDKSERVFDLYCGIGLITLFVSHFAKETIGVEIAKSSVRDANHNIQINNIASNVRFIESPVENVVDTLGTADVVIIDPPRKGLDDKTRQVILDIAPKKIIYSSCKVQTMARDIQTLSDAYEIRELVLADMFPQTHHAEMLALLVRK